MCYTDIVIITVIVTAHNISAVPTVRASTETSSSEHSGTGARGTWAASQPALITVRVSSQSSIDLVRLNIQI